MGITMEELAALANVSQCTVSLVLNGKGDGRIAKAKQEKIRDLARKHNYRPNMAAKGLRAQRQYTIGIIMPSPINSFYSDMVSRLQTSLANRGYMALYSFWKADSGIPQAYESVLQHNVDGVISWIYHECLHSETIPTAIYLCNDGNGFDSIHLDWQGYVREAIDYLVSLGHSRIGLGILKSDARYQYFIEYMQKLGLTVNPDWLIDMVGTLEGGAEFMKILLKLNERPTALVMLNDSMAYSAISLASRAGLKTPRDLSVIGYNDLPESSYFEPPLTTFNCHNQIIVDSLIDLILQRIENPASPVKRLQIPKAELIIRSSCSKPNQ